jgi:predicted RND superfamily exporter protein
MVERTIQCKDCGDFFPSATTLEIKVQKCSKCVEKSQDEMLRIMFGEDPNMLEANSSKIQMAKIADYSNEPSNKVLDLNSLIEVIHEFFDPTFPHDSEYLRIRINLLRNLFDIGSGSNNPNSRVIDELLDGYGEIKKVRVLPFEGALEVPDSIDTEAHFRIEKQFKKELKQIRDNAYVVQRAYITYLIQHSISKPRLRSKTVTLAELISQGLPKTDLGIDYDSY